ncbi:CaiB/BaiF CoA transferase family protein [Amycolatopsis acidicola]|nr:CoA transferase [Amycolatopsis acidicola]
MNEKQGPLAGVRVADFGHVLAGPYSTMLLAELGAEVIKIESGSKIDEQRVLHGAGASKDPEASSNFFEINLNKRSVTLNLKQERGVELAERIVAKCDVVMENMRPGVMDRLGLGYETLRAVKPDIIMLSLSGFGATGPFRSYTAYAPCFTCFSGQANLTGYADGTPNQLTSSGDSRAGTTGAFAILAALLIRQRTGAGQYIDLSSSEALNQLIGDQMMDWTMNRRSPSRTGNHDAQMAPHNVYRTAGDDEWVSIAVQDDDHWAAFVGILGSPSWATDPDLATSAGRLAREEELDERIAAWTRTRRASDLTEKLQAAGIAAMPSFTAEQVFNDPQLLHRGAITEVDHVRLGRRRTIAPPWLFSRTPARITRPAPQLGEDNDEILGGLLGIQPDELEDHIAVGAVR